MSGMVRALALVTLLLTAAARPVSADEQPSASQKASIFAKASVVRVLGYFEVTFRIGDNVVKEYVGGMGSGFFASADGFVVTNAHVVEDVKEGETAAKQKAARSVMGQLAKKFPADFAQMTGDQQLALYNKLVLSATVDMNNDIVLPDGTKLKYDVMAYGKPGEGTDVAVIKVDTKDAPNLPIADSDKVQLQDKVLAIGYPGAADMQGLLDAKSQLEATINDGAVSAVKRTAAGEPIIQISASITHGNSGGPTINDKGEVIGLSTFGSKGEVQGFNFIVASATVKKFLKQAKANTAPSSTIKVWRKGLDEWWAGDLDQAIVDLEETATLFPLHSEAPRVIKLVRQMKKEGKGKKPESKDDGDSGGGGGSGKTSSAGIVVAIVFVMAIVIGVLILMMRGKKKPAIAGPHVPGMAAPGMPPPGMAPNMAAPGMMPGMAPPGPPPGAPGYAGPAPGPPMMAGRSGPAPIAKTMAIGGSQPHGPVAATAFGSLTLASLTCTRGLLNGQRFALTPQGLLIGRQPGVAQIVVNDSRASGKHVWIGYENGTLVAIDQGTTNGTYINDIRNGRISKAPLKDGDTVIVGEPDCLSLTLKLS